MKRELLQTPAFVRAAKRFLKRHPEAMEAVATALELLETDLFDSRLRSHKLKGELEGSWACSAGYDIRILFRLVARTAEEGGEALALLGIGSHEDVY